jgi:hypothetical protein
LAVLARDMVIPLPSSFRVHSEDPAFHVSWRGGGRFVLSGEVTMSPSAELDVATPHDEVEVSLATHSTPTHAVSALRRALPRGILMHHAAHADGVELIFNEAMVPAAKPPRLRFFTAGVRLNVKQLDENCIEFLGGITDDVLVTILCDSRRATVKLTAGMQAHTAATLIGANMPHGFRAIVDGAIVTVWKDADFFSAVA